MTTTFASKPAPDTRSADRAVPAAPRMDLYAGIHKALRAFMTDTLGRVGRLDVFDADESARTLAQLEGLLTLCESHIAHENQFVHAAIEARAPSGSARIADEHVEHLHSIAALRAEARDLAAAPAADRMALALRLYRHLALFVAENFQHMHIEETVHNAALWAHYSDAELAAIHGRLMAVIPPEENLLVARWMLPALSPTERAGMLGAVAPTMPAPVFDAILGHVQPHVDDAGWTKLMRALGRPVAAPPTRP
jgi:hypothetical protein